MNVDTNHTADMARVISRAVTAWARNPLSRSMTEYVVTALMAYRRTGGEMDRFPTDVRRSIDEWDAMPDDEPVKRANQLPQWLAGRLAERGYSVPCPVALRARADIRAVDAAAVLQKFLYASPENRVTTYVDGPHELHMDADGELVSQDLNEGDVEIGHHMGLVDWLNLVQELRGQPAEARGVFSDRWTEIKFHVDLIRAAVM